MVGYILRRSLLVVPVVWGAMTLLFLVFFILPGDTVDQLVGEGKAVTPAVRANIEAKLGLDQPWYVQYGRYWARVGQGDLGESFQTNRSVNDVLESTAPASVRLAFWAMVVEVAIGVTVGLVSAIKRYSFIDTLTTVSTTMLIAVPVFVLGYILQIMLGVYAFQHEFPEWARFPVQGIGPNSWSFFLFPTNGQWRYLVLPVIALASVHTAVVARMTRTTMLEVNRADYMRTAAAKGLTPRRIIFKHGLKNAMIPVVTLIGIDLATLIGSAILTETVFNWPGVGSTIARALGAQDAPIVLGLSLVVVLAYVVINLIVDISYAFFDPRIRYGSEVTR
ncbi:MAG: ABC transporter permease [Actinomycetota bacterium]|nr:ABC transporter permease [Actinomycetota bacterium]HSH23512.1 ABC transporter permease [Acidimicrobiales bacterium]